MGYSRQLLAAIARLPNVVMICVKHDEHCPALTSDEDVDDERCQCEPDVEIVMQSDLPTETTH